MRKAAAAALAAALGPAAAAAEPPAAFRPCLACHVVEGSSAGLPGPSLANLIGRPVAGDPDFAYSPALAAAGAGGAVWSAARLDAFLRDPEAMFPGSWMSYPGVADPADRAAIVAYLGD